MDIVVNPLLARITVEPGKRSDKPCIRGMRITVWDFLIYLANCNYPTRIVAELLRRNAILVHAFEQKDAGVLILRYQ